MASQDVLRVGIISANWGAKSHLPAWRSVPGVEVTAICTSRQETAEAAAADFGIDRPFWDYEAMAADPDIDIIDAGTSPGLREKMVAAAIAGRKHVVNQLPFATTGERADALVSAQRAAGVQGIAAASLVGLPHVEWIREMIAGGEIGEPFQLVCNWQMSYFIPPLPGFPYDWFGKAGLGVGVTRNQGSHLLHLMRHLFGPIASVSGRTETRLKGWQGANGEWVENETDDVLHAMLRFENGPMAQLATSWTAVDSPGFSLDIFGSKGRLTLSALRFPGVRSASLYKAAPGPYMQPSGEAMALPDRFLKVGDTVIDPAAATDPSAGDQLPSMARLFGGLADAIRNGGEPAASFERALHVQRTVEALYRSNQNQHWENVG